MPLLLKNFTSIRLGLFICISLSGCLLLAGCAMNLNHWKGQKKSKLVSTWGSPKKTISDNKGGKIYVYDRSPWETRTNYLGNNTGPTRLIGFYINKRGVIYGWKELPLGKSLYK